MKNSEMKKAILRARKAINRKSMMERKSARREKEIRKLACYSQHSGFSYDWYNPDWEEEYAFQKLIEEEIRDECEDGNPSFYAVYKPEWFVELL